MLRDPLLRDSFRPTPTRTSRLCRGALSLVLLVPLVVFAACAPEEEPPPVETAEAPAPEPNRLTSEALGYAVVDPAGGMFEPIESSDDEIRLRFAADETFSEGTVIFGAEPEQSAGVNLVDAVNARKAELELMPDGKFHGQAELGSENLGRAYSTRGRYTNEAGEEIEEFKIFAVHPTANRLIHMTYRYIPGSGQTQVRLTEQALVAFGYIEAMDAESNDAESMDGAEGDSADVATGDEAG